MLLAALTGLAGSLATTTTTTHRRGGQGATGNGLDALHRVGGTGLHRIGTTAVSLLRHLQHLLQGLALVRLHRLLYVTEPLATLTAVHVCSYEREFIGDPRAFPRIQEDLFS